MVESIEIGKPYSLRLLDIYGGTYTNLMVVGSTNIDNVVNNTKEYNIFENFFEPIGLGLATYYAAINKNTIIYICVPITSLNPFEIDSENKVYVPQSLINFKDTEEYIKSVKFYFTIGSLYRRYDSDEERDNFVTEVIDKIKKRLSGMIDMSLEEIEIEPTMKDTYLIKSKIDSIEEERSLMYKEHLSKVRETLDINSEREKQYNETIYNLNTKIAEYDELNKALNLEKQRYSGLCVSLQNKLDQMN